MQNVLSLTTDFNLYSLSHIFNFYCALYFNKDIFYVSLLCSSVMQLKNVMPLNINTLFN